MVIMIVEIIVMKVQCFVKVFNAIPVRLREFERKTNNGSIG